MNREKNDGLMPENNEKKRRSLHEPSRMERTGREHSRRWLFLAVDVLLLAAIAAAVVFLLSLLTPFSLFDNTADEVRSVTYTVEIAGVDRDFVSALRVGDTVTDKETGEVIGTVTEINARPYAPYTNIPTEEKDPVLDSYVVTKAEYPESFNTVEITISVDADYTAGVGYAVEDCRIAVGREYDLYFPRYAGKGVCVELIAKTE